VGRAICCAAGDSLFGSPVIAIGDAHDSPRAHDSPTATCNAKTRRRRSGRQPVVVGAAVVAAEVALVAFFTVAYVPS
jgi:hypothetical protein